MHIPKNGDTHQPHREGVLQLFFGKNPNTIIDGNAIGCLSSEQIFMRYIEHPVDNERILSWELL